MIRDVGRAKANLQVLASERGKAETNKSHTHIDENEMEVDGTSMVGHTILPDFDYGYNVSA